MVESNPLPAGDHLTLDQLQGRRRAGLPAVSTLIGPARAPIALWNAWAVANGFHTAVVIVTDHAALPTQLLRELARLYDLRALASDYLHTTAKLPRPLSEAMTDRDRSQLIAAASANSNENEVIRCAASLLQQDDTPGDSGLAVQLPTLPPQPPDGSPWQRLRAVAALIPADSLPAFLFHTLDGNSAAGHWLDEVASSVFQVAEALPHWPLGLCCTSAEWDDYLARAVASRAKSLLRAGETRVAVLEGAQIASRLQQVVPDAGTLSQSVACLTSLGATHALTDSYATAARLRPQKNDAARSAAERFLFELLEMHPRTAGLFVLNAKLDFAFGPRAAEVDLSAQTIRLALEVDGYHHFTDADAYRRDRRKDWTLQRHGYTVLRVLAEDVVVRANDVLETIVQAVDHCGRSGKPAS